MTKKQLDNYIRGAEMTHDLGIQLINDHYNEQKFALDEALKTALKYFNEQYQENPE